jgi:hypothetical protein
VYAIRVGIRSDSGGDGWITTRKWTEIRRLSREWHYLRQVYAGDAQAILQQPRILNVLTTICTIRYFTLARLNFGEAKVKSCLGNSIEIRAVGRLEEGDITVFIATQDHAKIRAETQYGIHKCLNVALDHVPPEISESRDSHIQIYIVGTIEEIIAADGNVHNINGRIGRQALGNGQKLPIVVICPLLRP